MHWAISILVVEMEIVTAYRMMGIVFRLTGNMKRQTGLTHLRARTQRGSLFCFQRWIYAVIAHLLCHN